MALDATTSYRPTLNGEWATFNPAAFTRLVLPSAVRSSFATLSSYSITTWFFLSSVSSTTSVFEHYI